MILTSEKPELTVVGTLRTRIFLAPSGCEEVKVVHGPYDKTNGEITRVPRLTAAYHKVREETKDWGDYEKLPEEIPEFPLIRRMLLGAVSVVQTPRLRAFETNERRIGNFVATMDTYFVGRNAAVLQYTQFAYTDQATRRRISNAATPKPGRFDEEWAGLGLAPMKILPEA